MTLATRTSQRRPAIMVGLVHLSTSSQQPRDDVGVAAMARSIQRGQTMQVYLVDIEATSDEGGKSYDDDVA